MMSRKRSLRTTIFAISLLPCLGLTQSVFEMGDDVFVGDSTSSLATNAERDAFVGGFSVHMTGNVAGDAHVAGFSVNLAGNVEEDLYIAGSNISISGSIGEDVTIAGFTVQLQEGASIAGNTRIAAATLVSDAPVEGYLVATGGTVTLNNTVTGDVSVTAKNIVFGENARINGTLRYSASKPIDIPASVIDPARVQYLPYSADRHFDDVRDTLDDTIKGFWPSFFSAITGAIITLVFLTLIAALLLAMAPVTVERLRQRAIGHGWRAMFFGFLGLSALIGLIPVSLMTIVGIPLALVVLLALVVIWALGYLMGVYTIFSKVFTAYREPVESTGTKVLVVAIGLVAFALLNYIPIIGWLINLGVVLLGIGLFTMAAIEKLQTETRAPELNTEGFAD